MTFDFSLKKRNTHRHVSKLVQNQCCKKKQNTVKYVHTHRSKEEFCNICDKSTFVSFFKILRCGRTQAWYLRSLIGQF